MFSRELGLKDMVAGGHGGMKNSQMCVYNQMCVHHQMCVHPTLPDVRFFTEAEEGRVLRDAGFIPS